MRVTIFGATGLLGKALMREWTGDDLSGLGSNDADIRDPKQISNVLQRTRPDWIVLAAAYADVDGCEQNREHRLRCELPRGTQRGASCKAVRFPGFSFSVRITFSTAAKNSPYETNDPRAPLNVYGRSKAEAEVQISRVLPECCILRTSWLFGIDGKCFPDTILKLAASRPAIDVVERPAGISYLHGRPGANDHPALPVGRLRNCARNQSWRLFVV